MLLFHGSGDWLSSDTQFLGARLQRRLTVTGGGSSEGLSPTPPPMSSTWNESRTAGAPQAFLCLLWVSSGQPNFSGDSGRGVWGVRLAQVSESTLWAALQLHGSGT